MHVSSMRVLLRLLLFLESNRFVFNSVIRVIVVFSWTSQFLTLEACQVFPKDGILDFSKVSRQAPLPPPSLQWFRKKDTHDEHCQQSKQRAEVQLDHCTVETMLQTKTVKTCTQEYFDGSASVSGVAPNGACTNQSVLSRRYPRSHVEPSVSTGQTLDNDMLMSKGKLFLHSQAARVDHVSLSVASSSNGDLRADTREGREEQGMPWSHSIEMLQC